MKGDKDRVRLWQFIGVAAFSAFVIIERHNIQKRMRLVRNLSAEDLQALEREGYVLIGIATCVLLFTCYLFFRQLRERFAKRRPSGDAKF